LGSRECIYVFVYVISRVDTAGRLYHVKLEISGVRVMIRSAHVEYLFNIPLCVAQRNYSYWIVVYADRLGPIGCSYGFCVSSEDPVLVIPSKVQSTIIQSVHLTHYPSLSKISFMPLYHVLARTLFLCISFPGPYIWKSETNAHTSFLLIDEESTVMYADYDQVGAKP